MKKEQHRVFEPGAALGSEKRETLVDLSVQRYAHINQIRKQRRLILHE
jgi:hypothetical protein